jgi:hypothetical protein
MDLNQNGNRQQNHSRDGVRRTWGLPQEKVGRRAVRATGGTILVRAEVSLKSRHRYRFDKSNRESANRRLRPRAS